MTLPLRSTRPQPSPAPRAARLRAVGQPSPPQAGPAAAAPSRRRAGLAAAVLLFVTVLAGNVTVHASTTQGQFELERLRQQADQGEAAYQRLRLEVAELQAPARIAAEARRMGLVEPVRVTYLTPTASTSAGGPPRPADDGDVPAEAAQSWGQVKPHLGPGR